MTEVEERIVIKRGELMASMILIRDAREAVLRFQAHTAVLEAQMEALSIENEEEKRINRVENMGKIPFACEPNWFDRSKYLPLSEIESGVCGEPRPIVVN